MKITSNFKQIIIISSILLLVGIGCRLTGAVFPGLAKNVPTDTPEPIATMVVIEPDPTIEISPDSIIVSFSESDLLGWIQQYQESQPDYKLTNPTVSLDDGLVGITGNLEAGIITGKMEVGFGVTVNPEGTPVVTVEAMKLADMDIPAEMREQFGSAINTAIASSIVSEMEGRKIESIVIDDGRMTIASTN